MMNAVMTGSFRNRENSLLWCAAVMAAFGVIMVFDASAVSAALRARFDNSLFFFQRQLIWFSLGLTAMILAAKLPLNKFRYYIFPAFILIILLLVCVLIPGLGVKVGGAKRWLRIGPVSVQPGELIRLMLTVYLAHLASIRKNSEHLFRDFFLPASIMTLIPLILLSLQPKFGTALILVILSTVIMFAGGIPIRYLLLAGASVTPFVIYAFTHVSYIQNRVAAWLDPVAHARDAGFQVTQSLIAIGSGGVTGVGFGQGRQKIFYLPEAHTDMIFPVIAEELGLIGSLLLIAFFSFIFFKGLKIARSVTDPFGQILAVGLVFAICIPATVNIMVATGLFPVTGIALPFISFGGTTLITDMVALGLLAGIPKWAKNEESCHAVA